MSKTPSTAFIIRMHFSKDDKRYPWRFNYFASMVLPKLLSQNDQDFDICIWANKWHAKEIKALSPKIKIFDVVPEKHGHIKPGYEEKAKIYFVDFVNFEDTRGLKQYEIQIGIDSDDMPIRDDFISRIKKEVAFAKSKPLHISFQPQVFQPSTLRTYRCDFVYGPAKGSPIFAIYQPAKTSKAEYIFAYEDSHLKLPKIVKRAIRIAEPYCVYSVHKCNSSTLLHPNQRQIML